MRNIRSLMLAIVYAWEMPGISPPPTELTPLLCAGLIGYPALRFMGGVKRIGLYGFGAVAHIISQVLNYQRRPFYAFTRPDDQESQQFALRLGAAWARASANAD